MNNRIKNGRRRFLGTALGAICAAGVAHVSRAAIPDGITLRVGLAYKPGPDIQLQVANELANLPYKIEWFPFEAAPPVAEALKGGHVDVFSGGDTLAVALAANAENIRIVGASTRSVFAGLLVNASSPCRSVADLKGKRVGVYRGSSSHYSLILLLEQAGLHWTDIETLYLTQADGLSALLTGKIDAWAAWDPNTAVAQKQYGARLLASVPNDYSYSVQFTSTSVLSDAARTAALQDFLVRSQRAADWVRHHPQVFAGQEEKLIHLPADVARLVAGRMGGEYVPINDALIGKLQREAAIFQQLGIIPRAGNIGAITDNRFNASLAAVASS